MTHLWLPIHAAISNPKTERQALIMRLNKIGYGVVGAEWPDKVEISELRDILDMCEWKAAHQPQIATPQPRFTKKEIAEALKEVKRFREERAAGRRHFY